MKTVLLILVSVVALSFAAYHTVKNLPHRRKQEDKGCREEEVGSPCRSPGKACAESGAAAGKKDDTISYVYSRLENYFITDRPFLDGNLGINDVARRLYTNKAYVSMAIHRFTGLNYCQYVNRYRIRYAVELFKENPSLRINEMASLSGFNSMASFNISFRAFMMEAPREWCKRIRQSTG